MKVLLGLFLSLSLSYGACNTYFLQQANYYKFKYQNSINERDRKNYYAMYQDFLKLYKDSCK